MKAGLSLNGSITPLLSCIAIGLFFGNDVAAQFAGSRSDSELRALKNDISAKSRIIDQLRESDKPVPADMRSGVLSYLFPYSPELSQSELQLAFTVLGAVARLSEDQPLASDEVDAVIGWMIARGWGELALVRSARDGNLTSAQFASLIDGLLTREEPLDYARTRAVDPITHLWP